MAELGFSALTELLATAPGDVLAILDVSDTAQGVNGSTRKITRDNLLAHLADVAASGDFADLIGVSNFVKYGNSIVHLKAASGEGLSAGVPLDGWYHWAGGTPVAVDFTGRVHSINWEGEAAVRPTDGTGDSDFQVGDIYNERASAL